MKIRFVASEALSPLGKEVIEKEYGMRGGKLVVTTRGALVQYTIQAFQADAMTPGRLLRVDNEQDIAAYLFS